MRNMLNGLLEIIKAAAFTWLVVMIFFAPMVLLLLWLGHEGYLQ